MYKLIFVLALIFIIIGFFNYISKFNSDYNIKVSLGSKEYKVEKANSEIKKITGLSNRKSMCSKCGMLFIFENDSYQAIWMKDMNFNIDLIFVDSDMTIVDVYENFAKESYIGPNPQKYINKTKAKYLIELNAGEWAKSGANIGDKISINSDTNL